MYVAHSKKESSTFGYFQPENNCNDVLFTKVLNEWQYLLSNCILLYVQAIVCAKCQLAQNILSSESVNRVELNYQDDDSTDRIDTVKTARLGRLNGTVSHYNYHEQLISGAL